jgi:hypothetical protein
VFGWARALFPVCMHVCMYICMYVSMLGIEIAHACLDRLELFFLCAFMFICMYVCIYVCEYARYRNCACVFGSTQLVFSVCLYVCMYVYI